MERQEKKQNIERSETDEVKKTFLEKLKSLFCSCKAKKSKDSPRLNKNDEPQKTFLSKKLKSIFSSVTGKSSQAFKRPRTAGECDNLTDDPQKKTKVQKPAKSLRTYIKRNWKWVVLFLVNYIITFGVVISVPFIVDLIKVISKNETEKERFE